MCISESGDHQIVMTKGSFDASTFKDVTFGMLLLYHFNQKKKRTLFQMVVKKKLVKSLLALVWAMTYFAWTVLVMARQSSILLLRPECMFNLQLNGSVEVERVLRVVMMMTRMAIHDATRTWWTFPIKVQKTCW
jgi:ABC-type sulfate transport system permease component